MLLIWLLAAAQAAAADRIVVAVNIGWHVGLAVEARHLDPAVLPEVEDFPDARWIEIGWGDAAFYQDPDPGLGTMLEAALTPTPAVLHLVAMPAEPAHYLPQAEVLAFRLDDAQFDRLIAYVSDHMDRGGARRARAIGPGLYPVSRFYPAHGEFSLDRTCNTWVAQALAAAGLPVEADGVARASTLMARLRAALGGRSSPEAEPSDRR
jgi:uncharacterized protein (TIGR02117 family)